MKTGIGKHNSDKDINLSTRGVVEALTVEVVDGSGNQLTQFFPVGLAPTNYDSTELTYTSSAKTTLSAVVFKLSGITVATITVTYPSSVMEVYTKT